MQPITAETVNDLNALAPARLRKLWKELRPRAEPPKGKRLLVREIAWRLQATAQGDLDPVTRRLLRAAMRGVEIEGRATTKRAKRKPRLKLEAGTTFVREWGGSTHEVRVGDDGRTFRYRDKTYSSLTTIAGEITGSHWSGPRFFGLADKGKAG